MDQAAYAGILMIPLLLAAVEAVKRALKLDTRYVPLVAVAFGLALSLLALLSESPVTTPRLAAAIVQGLAWGLAAVGLYSGTRNVTRP